MLKTVGNLYDKHLDIYHNSDVSGHKRAKGRTFKEAILLTLHFCSYTWPLSSLRTMSVISLASLCSKQISAKVFFLFKKVIATIKCSPITQLFETKSSETLEHSLENIISSGLVEVILQFCAPIYYYNSQQVQLKERQVLNYCVTSLRNSHCCFCYTIYQYSWQNCYFRFSTQFRMSLEWFRDSKIQSEGIS